MAAVTQINAMEKSVRLFSYRMPYSHANTALYLGEVLQVVTCL